MPTQRKSIMRSLGEFVGHIAGAIRSTPHSPTPGSQPPQGNVTRRDVHEEVRETSIGAVKLKRTVIEEVVMLPQSEVSTPPSNPGSASAPS